MPAILPLWRCDELDDITNPAMLRANVDGPGTVKGRGNVEKQGIVVGDGEEGQLL
jgi:hypothetical protein